MPRYFIEVAYKGTNYSGFQMQQNANSIQAEVGKALKIFFKQNFDLTGASRTDAGVHALQNYFHFEEDLKTLMQEKDWKIILYSLNALLPADIIIKKIALVANDAHCRFDALEREYKYYIYQDKNPFLQDRAYYYPYKIDIEKLHESAYEITRHQNFSAFSKRNTQVNHFLCNMYKSNWVVKDDVIIYTVAANRFLRGMVRGLVGTMLKVSTGKISAENFRSIIKNMDSSQADFSVPSNGLFLINIKYPFTF